MHILVRQDIKQIISQAAYRVYVDVQAAETAVAFGDDIVAADI